VSIWVYGEFDLKSEERFRSELAAALADETDSLVLDLRGVEFIDSTVLRLLVQVETLTRREQIEFAVVCGPGQVRSVLRLTGLDGVLPLVDSTGAVPASESPV